MPPTEHATANRLTCVAFGLDLRGLFLFGRKLIQAGQRPILANKVEMAAEFATRFALSLIAIQVPQGNVELAVRELTRQLLDQVPSARLVLEVPSTSGEPQTGVSQAGAIHFFGKDDPPARVKAVFDVATFAEGLVGSVAQLDLIDFLQLLIMNHQSRAVVVHSPGGVGDLVVKDGNIVDARCGGLRGEQALFKILGQRSGKFSEVPLPATIERTIEGRGEMLLLEAMRLRDEGSREPSKS